VTTATDLVLLSSLVLFTGGAGSVFYFAYFIVLVSNSIRYGMGMAIYVATVYNLVYVAVLAGRPPATDLTVEAVKILTFWGVALYAGYLAMRFQRQTRILESYEETIARLRAELTALRPPAK
jgi:K+-sensing histidine kinase KdpD